LVITASVIIATLWLFVIVGLPTVRRHVLPRVRIRHEDSDLTATVVHSIMVFYGLTVALIAQQAFELSALYRDANSYRLIALISRLTRLVRTGCIAQWRERVCGT